LSFERLPEAMTSKWECYKLRGKSKRKQKNDGPKILLQIGTDFSKSGAPQGRGPTIRKLKGKDPIHGKGRRSMKGGIKLSPSCSLKKKGKRKRGRSKWIKGRIRKGTCF